VARRARADEAGLRAHRRGRRVLDTWAEALRRAQATIGTFLERYEEGR